MQDALHQAEQEMDEAWAAQQQASDGSTQPLMQQFRQELAAVKQELEQLRSRMSAPTPAAEVAKLQSQLQEAQAALTAQQSAVPESVSQARVTALEQECQQAQGHIHELLDEF